MADTLYTADELSKLLRLRKRAANLQLLTDIVREELGEIITAVDAILAQRPAPDPGDLAGGGAVVRHAGESPEESRCP